MNKKNKSDLPPSGGLRGASIIADLALTKRIERYIYQFSPDKELLADLAQEVYMELLNYPESRIIESYQSGKLPYLAFRIAKNMIFSTTSRFYYNYIRYEINKRGDITDYEEYRAD